MRTWSLRKLVTPSCDQATYDTAHIGFKTWNLCGCTIYTALKLRCTVSCRCKDNSSLKPLPFHLGTNNAC